MKYRGLSSIRWMYMKKELKRKKMDKVKILADEIYNQKVLDGWKNVSMEDCLKRATDYYIIDEIVKNKTKQR